MMGLKQVFENVTTAGTLTAFGFGALEIVSSVASNMTYGVATPAIQAVHSVSQGALVPLVMVAAASGAAALIGHFGASACEQTRYPATRRDAGSNAAHAAGNLNLITTMLRAG